MKAQIFVNLPVKDLNKSIAFYKEIGFTQNPKFSDDTAACMVLSEEIFVMLLTHAKFSQFTSKAIADATKTAEVINALSVASKDEVNNTAAKAIKAGGAVAAPDQDYGFMFNKSISDPDGHIWEFFWMDPAAAE